MCSTPDGIDDRDGRKLHAGLRAKGVCSTPDGIDDRDGLKNGYGVNSWRSAQRLTASMIATDRDGAERVQEIAARVLNA